MKLVLCWDSQYCLTGGEKLVVLKKRTVVEVKPLSFFFLVLQDKVSLCSSGTCSINQAGLCLPSAGIKGVHYL